MMNINNNTDGIPKSVHISMGVILIGKYIIGENSTINEYSIIGKNINSQELDNNLITNIGKNVRIGCYSVLYQGCKIADGCIIDDYVKIGYCSALGYNTRVLYGAKIYKHVIIGSDSIIGGFVCNRVRIGKKASIFGKLIHRYPRPKWGIKEPSPVIGDNVVVGMGSIIIGGVKIGNNSYIASGSIVTKDVPENTIVKPNNPLYIPFSSWKGRMKE